MISRMWLSLAVSVAVGGVAQAAQPLAADPDAPAVMVRTSDLDLSRTADARVLLGRVRQAADDVCGGAPSLGDLAAQGAYRVCMRATMDNAIAKLHAPVVTALYQGPPTAALASTGGPG